MCKASSSSYLQKIEKHVNPQVYLYKCKHDGKALAEYFFIPIYTLEPSHQTVAKLGKGLCVHIVLWLLFFCSPSSPAVLLVQMRSLLTMKICKFGDSNVWLDHIYKFSNLHRYHRCHRYLKVIFVRCLCLMPPDKFTFHLLKFKIANIKLIWYSKIQYFLFLWVCDRDFWYALQAFFIGIWLLPC